MKKMERKGIRPSFRLGLGRPVQPHEFHRVFPFRRNWIAIAVVAVMDAVFLFPAITTFQQAIQEWSRLDSLFDLTGALFLTGWLMGWSLAPLGLTTVLLLMLFGRETLRASTGQVELTIGVPGLGFSALYEASGMRNLRLEQPEKSSGTSWRSQHAAFDYGANDVSFGSGLGSADLAAISSGLHMATGQKIRVGEATPKELEGDWGPNQLQRIVTKPKAAIAEQTAVPSEVGNKLKLSSPSTLLLIVANMVPLFGASFLDWQLSDVMVLYWAESAVVGFYNVLKIIMIGKWFAVLGAPFFIGHFGAFMAVHFLFLYGLFVKGPADMSGGDLAEVAQLFFALWPGLVALFISHGFSFVHNFMGQREYRNRSMNTQMSEPYRRIIFMHLVLIFGGGITLFLGEPTPVLLVVIALKIWFDVRAHLAQHGSETPGQPPHDAAGA